MRATSPPSDKTSPATIHSVNPVQTFGWRNDNKATAMTSSVETGLSR